MLTNNVSAGTRFVRIAMLGAVLACPAAATGQDTLVAEWSVEAMTQLSTESLMGRLAYVSNELANYRPIYGETWADKTRLDFLQQAQAALSALLKGRPPDAVVGGGGSGGGSGPTGPRGTQLTEPARPRGGSTDTTKAAGPPGSSYVLPLLVVLTAAQAAKCEADGVPPMKCAEGLAEQAAIAAGVKITQALITVVSPAGGVIVSGIVTALGVGASAVSLIYTTAIVGAETVRTARDATADLRAQRELEAQRTANAERMTKENMRKLVDLYRAKIGAARIDPASRDAMTSEMASLTKIVDRARTELAEFRNLNNASKLASASCRDPSKNPVGYAADAERRVSTMQRLADDIGKNVGEARTLVAPPCDLDRAARARQLYDSAQYQLRSLEQNGVDARVDLTDTLKFFAAVKAGRASAGDARKRITALESRIDEARSAGQRVTDAIASYRPALERAQAANAGVALAVATLREAFPLSPPPHIKEGLKEVDDEYVQTASSWLTDDRLLALANQAGDELARVEGFHRLAEEELDDVSACTGITDEIPQPLRTHLTTLGNEIDATVRRATQTMAGASDIPGKADACLQQVATADGRLTGDCTGTIKAVPERGAPGALLMISIAIDPPFDQQIARVSTDNPACRNDPQCDAERAAPGRFTASLRFQAPVSAATADGVLGVFRVKFVAYDRANRARCTGQTNDLTVMAPRR